VVPADRSRDPVRLTTTGHARGPAWAPDGRQLAFLDEHDGGFDIYVLDVAADANPITAGSPQQVTGDGAVDATAGLSWSR
jgi:TolB protein